MKGSNIPQPQTVFKINALNLCIRLALGIMVTSIVATSTAVAEGTKQYAPTANDYAALAAMETGGGSLYPFAGYDQPAENRLHIHIADPAKEIVYIGLGKLTGQAGNDIEFNYYWRIKAPDGTVVKTGTLAGGSASNITRHAQAVAGPVNLAAGGYPTGANWTFDPAAAGKGAGDYYIEFDINNNAATVGTYTEPRYNPASDMNIKWFDITVATKGENPTAIDGRLWSKKWGVRTNDPAVFPTAPFGTPFNGALYTYDDKNFVTKVDFLNSGLRPLQGQFSFNNTGTGTTGVKATDRKSVMNVNATTPLHKIFLNQPDPAVYPLGTEGQLQNLPLQVNDPNNAAIKVEVTQPGQVEIILDFGNDGSFTAGTDRRLHANVVAGVNQVPWDGKNGAGVKVTAAQFPIKTMIAYTQGETHFTAYDVEGLDNGFKVYTQSNAGITGPNLQFWDDSNISQISGVTPTVLTNTDTGATTRQRWNYVSADQTTGYGNANTINTWWFAYRDYETTVLRAFNTLPVATDDSASTDEDTVLNGSTVLVNDSDADGDTLSVNTTPVTAPTHGTLVLKADGTYTYTPNANYNGTDSFTYEISDGNGGTDTATVTLTIGVTNDPPTASDDTASGVEDAVLNGGSVLTNDSDIDGDTLTVNTTPVVAPTHGTLVLKADGTYSYTPDKNFNGTDSFTYEVSDGNGGMDTATVTLSISPSNDAPIALDDAASTPEDTVLNGTTVLSNDSDIDGDALSVTTTPVAAPTHGTLVLKADGTYTYTPAKDFNGTDSFTYEVSDGKGGKSTAVVNLTISPVNDAPTITSVNNVTFAENGTGTALDVQSIDDSDAENSGLTYSLLPMFDAAVFNLDPATGAISFKAPPDYEAPKDSNGDNAYILMTKVCDSGGLCTEQVKVIVVTNLVESNPPVISVTSLKVPENQTFVTTVAAYDPDVDNTLTFSIKGGADAALFQIDPSSGVLTFKTAPDFEKPNDANTDNAYELIVSVWDGTTPVASHTAEQALKVTVVDVQENTAPTITSDGAGDTANVSQPETQLAVTTVVATDADAGETLIYSINGGTNAALFHIDPISGKLSFKTAPKYVESGDNTYEVSVKVIDARSGSDTQTLTVTILQDTDRDGLANTADADMDGDGIPNTTEGTTDLDGDGIPNQLDLDADNDGIPDNIEAQTTAGYKPPLGTDTNKDGIDDAYGTGLLPVDTDADTKADYLDTNSDDASNSDANDTTEAGLTLTGTDTDKDGLDDAVDTDDAMFGPANAGITSTLAAYPKLGTEVTWRIANLPPAILSPATATFNENRVEPVLDVQTQDDHDAEPTGITYSIKGGADAALFTIDPKTGVINFKAIPDYEQPLDSDTNNVYLVKVQACDAETACTTQDISITVLNIDESSDTDGDGLLDIFEKKGVIEIDTDGDGKPDWLDTDDDNDGILTQYEKPDTNGDRTPDDALDTDGDGKPNYLDNDDDGDGKPTADEKADKNRDGNPADAYDADADGIPSYLDPDEIPTVVLHVRGFLQGAYNTADKLMRDDLRKQGLLPLVQPYTHPTTSLGYAGTEALAPSLLTLANGNAPVDWVVVELRSKTSPKTVVARAAAILQRDGDLANPQTNEAKLLIPNVVEGQYHVSLRHRNHLGVTTQDAVLLSPTLSVVDFGLPTQTVMGSHARLLGKDVALLWAGEANNSDSIIANGPGNDTNVVLGTVLMHPTNLLTNSNFRLQGYYVTDLNLDGISLYSGPNNDINLLLGNVLLHPSNSLVAANYIIAGTIPK